MASWPRKSAASAAAAGSRKDTHAVCVRQPLSKHIHACFNASGGDGQLASWKRVAHRTVESPVAQRDGAVHRVMRGDEQALARGTARDSAWVSCRKAPQVGIPALRVTRRGSAGAAAPRAPAPSCSAPGCAAVNHSQLQSGQGRPCYRTVYRNSREKNTAAMCAQLLACSPTATAHGSFTNHMACANSAAHTPMTAHATAIPGQSVAGERRGAQ
jgi:hypothetical protein